MKTVLFIDKGDEDVWSSYLRYDFVLDEYCESGAFDVCSWHPDGMSVAAAVPDLAAIVGDEEQWRAIIVCDLRKESVAEEKDFHLDNPFDFPETYWAKLDDPLEESPHAIVRLTQMLGGLPEKAVIDWPDYDTCVKVVDKDEIPWLEEDDPIIEAVSLNEFGVEVFQLGERYDLFKRYRLGVPRPQMVMCVTPRDVDEDMLAERALEIGSYQRRRDEQVEIYLRRACDAEKAAEDAARARRQAERAASEEAALEKIALAEENEKKAETLRLKEEDRAFLEAKTSIGFWQRNNYPASARFIVCDRRAAAVAPAGEKAPLVGGGQSVTKRDDWFGFWLSVLCLATIDIPPSYLRPFTLHRMGVEIDEEQFDAVFSRRYTEWTAVRELISLEMEIEDRRIATSEFRKGELPDCTTTIAVPFDSVDENGLHAEPGEVGFFKDKPENDRVVWGRQHMRIMDEFRMLLRVPARGLSMAAEQFRMSSRLDPQVVEYCALNNYQRAELADGLCEIEYALARDIEPPSFEVETHRAEIDEGSDAVIDAIGKRATKPQSIVAAAIASAALFVGFAPYCFAMFGGAASNASAWLVTVVSVLVLLGVSAFTLWRMRNEVRGEYRGFNGIISRLMAGLRTEANRLGKRLSSYATFRKQHAILERQSRLAEPTERAVGLGRRDALLKTRMEDILQLAPNARVSYDEYRGILADGWPRAYDLLETPSFFSLCDATRVPRTLNGDTAAEKRVDVPYSFIADVQIVPIEVMADVQAGPVPIA